MIENIRKQINSFLSALKTTYNQQGQAGKMLVPVLGLLAFCCLCSILTSLIPLRLRDSSSPVPTPNSFPTAGNVATPTALFNFGTVTFAPFPTFPTLTSLPTLTASSTPTPTATPSSTPPSPTLLATLTPTPLPTLTNSPLPPPTATVETGGSVQILTVNKAMEYVDLQNVSNAPIDLRGWKLVSETGNQSCALRGVIQPGEVLRVWSGRGSPGLSCRFPNNIWNDNQSDPAVLYNAQGEEVSRFPPP